MNRCQKCVLPEQTPNITFDDSGVCNYCHTYRPVSYQGEDAFIARLEPFRNGARPYDCLVPISGGRDSSYVLLKLVKDYKMRVLAVNYENPFTVPQARTNIKNACQTLGVEVVHFCNGDKNHRITFRQSVEAWLQRPSPGLIPIVCIGCKPAWWHIYGVARRHHIPLIVSGGNPYEVISYKRELVGISRDEAANKAFYKYVYAIRTMLQNRAYFKPRLLLTMASSYLLGNPNSLGLKLVGRNITWLELFNFVPWNETTILNRIRQELGWDYPQNLPSSWRFDCRVKHMVDLMYLATLQLTDKEDFYAKLVREGRMDRATAVQRLTLENKPQIEEIGILLDQAGIRDTALVDALFAQTAVSQAAMETVG
ncbi:MAG: ATPase [Ardenticatenaceae bacterium]|nr:ATPase [Ardenticatenaceae bacterium]MCB9443936.1 ATPase [Ardenticatenaceae bacterium]